MRALLAASLIVHGIAHLVGFAVPWRLVTSADVPYTTTVVGGLFDLGPSGMKAVGLVWLLTAIAFVTIGVGMVAHTSWWYEAMLPLIVISAALCLLQWPDTRFGLLANVVILMLLGVSAAASRLAIP